MRENMLTTKESVLIADLLNYEQMACKKMALYSRTLTNEKVAEKFKQLSLSHKKRYEKLLILLKGE